MPGLALGRRVFWIAALTAGLTAGAHAQAPAPAWKPDRTVEIIVGTAPGAAPDRTARTIQRIWQVRGIFEGAANVVNKPGGGNVVAWTYLNQYSGNGHYQMIGNLNVVISRAIGVSPFTHSDFSWIAMLFDEYYALAVRGDSPVAGSAELVARLRKDPGSVTIGVSTSIGGGNHLSAALALLRAGVDVKRVRFVAFKGSADSVTALLGGHIDAVSAAVSAVVPYVKSAQLKAVAVSSPKRLPGPLAPVPTWTEQGINMTMTNFRAVMAPRGTAAGPVAYWERRYAQLAETAEWKAELESNLWHPNFMGTAKTVAAVAAHAEDVDSLVATLGLRKTP